MDQVVEMLELTQESKSLNEEHFVEMLYDVMTFDEVLVDLKPPSPMTKKHLVSFKLVKHE